MGGLTIMSTWLSQAAIEEQTSVIHVIFKVLIFFFGEHVMYLCGACFFFTHITGVGAAPPSVT